MSAQCDVGALVDELGVVLTGLLSLSDRNSSTYTAAALLVIMPVGGAAYRKIGGCASL